MSGRYHLLSGCHHCNPDVQIPGYGRQDSPCPGLRRQIEGLETALELEQMEVGKGVDQYTKHLQEISFV